jgi:hypothetical protein
MENLETLTPDRIAEFLSANSGIDLTGQRPVGAVRVDIQGGSSAARSSHGNLCGSVLNVPGAANERRQVPWGRSGGRGQTRRERSRRLTCSAPPRNLSAAAT